jgi:hypothetical protein
MTGLSNVTITVDRTAALEDDRKRDPAAEVDNLLCLDLKLLEGAPRIPRALLRAIPRTRSSPRACLCCGTCGLSAIHGPRLFLPSDIPCASCSRSASGSYMRPSRSRFYRIKDHLDHQGRRARLSSRARARASPGWRLSATWTTPHWRENWRTAALRRRKPYELQGLRELRDRDSNPKFVLQRHACCQLHHPGPFTQG